MTPHTRSAIPADPWIRAQILGRWVRKERKLVAAIAVAALIAAGAAASERDRSSIPLDEAEIRNLTELPLNPESGK